MSEPVEVEQIWPRDGNIEIVAALDEGLRRPEMVLVLRESPEVTMARPARPHAAGVSAVYSAETLALACPEGKGCWDAFLQAETADGSVRVRMGRHRDDIADKRNVMVYPAQLVPTVTGGIVVRPRYTVAGDISVECAPAEQP